VIANAGIMGNGDQLASAQGTIIRIRSHFSLSSLVDVQVQVLTNGEDDPAQAPIKPDFTVLDVDQTGVLYTAHLAMHYCRREGKEGKRGDKCLVIVSSMAGFTEQRGTLQYSISKNSGRVMMRTLRQGTGETGVRVNCIAPW